MMTFGGVVGMMVVPGNAFGGMPVTCSRLCAASRLRGGARDLETKTELQALSGR